jgi:hypothetical protein
MFAMLVTMGKHLLIDKVTPPPLLMAASVVVFSLSVADLRYEKDKAKEAKDLGSAVEQAVVAPRGKKNL